MCAQYGDKVLSRRIVYEWIEMFENGRTSVTDAENSGRPATARPQGMKKEPWNLFVKTEE